MTITNPFLKAAIDAEVAKLPREVDPPAGELGYGRDLSCVSDCTDDFAEVDPQSKLGIAQYQIRLLTTPRGGILDAPDLGFDVRALLNRGATPQAIQGYGDRIRTECLKDDRVSEVTPDIDFDFSTNTLTCTLAVVAVDASIGEFSYTFSVQPDGTVLLESISGT